MRALRTDVSESSSATASSTALRGGVHAAAAAAIAVKAGFLGVLSPVGAERFAHGVRKWTRRSGRLPIVGLTGVHAPFASEPSCLRKHLLDVRLATWRPFSDPSLPWLNAELAEPGRCDTRPPTSGC